MEKKKAFRQRRNSDSESDEERIENNEEELSAIELTKKAQELRRRKHGITAEQLAAGKEFKKERKVTADPLKLKTGGYVDLEQLKRAAAEDLPEEIGTSFAAETNRRDEDADMVKYVEAELARQKGKQQEESDKSQQQRLDMESRLYELPERLRNLAPSKKKVEDMLSNQMLSGIPEVDLGIEAKIRNIEKTEEAKQRLHQERLNKKDDISVFVPTNIAVNFVQHNRYNIEDTSRKDRAPAPKKPKVEPLRVGEIQRMTTEPSRPNTVAEPPKGFGKLDEKASDDFHFEKFRRQMRR